MKQIQNIAMTLFIATGLALMTGCGATLPTIADVDTSNMPENQALIILSTSADETCTSFSTGLVIKEKAMPAAITKSVGVFQLNNSFVKSDYNDTYAKVYTTVLAPGEYDFWLHAQNPFSTASFSDRFKPVTIEAKGIYYLGEFHVGKCDELNIQVSNQSERDLNFIKSKKPSLDLNLVSVEVVEKI